MLDTQLIRKKHLDEKVSKLREIIRQDTKEAARQGAYEGVMDAKIDILQREEDMTKNNVDSPLTIKEFQKLVKRNWYIKLALLIVLLIFGFIDFKDIISMFLSPFV